MSRNLALAALAVTAQGCGQPEQGLGNGPEAPASRGAESVPATSAARLSYWGVGAPPRQGPVGGAAARLDGILSRLDGCLVVGSGNGLRVQPVFPDGKARWDEESGTLSFAGRTYRPGDRITLGGGGVTSPSAYRREAGVRIAPCDVAELWAVIG